MFPFRLVWAIILILGIIQSLSGVPVEPPGKINDLPIINLFQPDKNEKVPIVIGERRCDNIYHGSYLPCLLRPELPPFSYSTESGYNTEYKKK